MTVVVKEYYIANKDALKEKVKNVLEEKKK